MQYSQLPKKAHRFIKPIGLPDQLRLSTKRHYVCRGLAVLGLLPLSASLLMAITLDGGEQSFYQVLVALLLPILFILGTLKHHLVLDNPSGQRFKQLQFMGFHFKKASQAPLQSTELLLRHDSHDRSQYELKIDTLVYSIGNLADTKQVVMFIAHTFKIPAKEQISDFPNIHDLTSLPPANATDDKNSHATDEIFPPIIIPPLWSPKVVLRFFYPLPFLMAFGVAIKFIGDLLHVL
ncbi:hypothetical protein FM038_020810 [Shewanella eurypsychrophilus]|uniref:Uncharacterized protein n=1 Tax=Shewanella eurypsychrophilus TaxID=2593656 RepID=A0ABX6VA60_9GAMM|nr:MULTISPECIES: hypothetical protein [Shewanella]QFU24347.1 hypothetical protein FS418_22515 [Shewanella sp. YLB-09]QPG59547.1 hypothetical protein FM038_020810 [Shewanella eurypsychrophilus]